MGIVLPAPAALQSSGITPKRPFQIIFKEGNPSVNERGPAIKGCEFFSVLLKSSLRLCSS